MITSGSLAWLTRVEETRGIRASIGDMSGLARGHEGELALPGGIFADTEILIGFTPRTYRPFLRSGCMEYHPGLRFRPVRRLPVRPDRVQAALLLRLCGVNPEQRARLNRWIAALPEDKRTSSATEGLLEALRDGAYIVPTRIEGSLYLTTPVLSSILRHGLTHLESSRRVTVMIYKTSSIPLGELLRRMRARDRLESPLTLLSVLARPPYGIPSPATHDA